MSDQGEDSQFVRAEFDDVDDLGGGEDVANGISASASATTSNNITIPANWKFAIEGGVPAGDAVEAFIDDHTGFGQIQFGPINEQLLIALYLKAVDNITSTSRVGEVELFTKIAKEAQNIFDTYATMRTPFIENFLDVLRKKMQPETFEGWPPDFESLYYNKKGIDATSAMIKKLKITDRDKDTQDLW